MSVDPRSPTLAMALLTLLLSVSTGAAGQESEHIFEPGKKHVCVPAASGEGWDCGTEEQPPASPAPREGPTLRGSRANDGASASLADVAASEPVAAAPPATSAAPSDVPPASRSVPSYLLAPPGGSESSAPAASSEPVVDNTPAAPPPPRPAAVEPPVASEPASAAPPAPVATAPPAVTDPEPPATATTESAISTTPQSTPEAAEPAATAQAAAPKEAGTPPPDRTAPAATAPPEAVAAPAAAPVSRVAHPRFADEAQQHAAFAALPGSAYVLDIAHGADRAAVAAAASIDLPVGQVWLLHLQRDGADWYVAAWGEFASVDMARAARAEAASHGVAEVGWPRKVGPLQQELRLQH